MTFHVRIAITGVHKEPARSVVALGDTIVVGKDGNQVLTSGIQKKYAEISYSLEESEPEEVEQKPKQQSTTKKSSTPKVNGNSQPGSRNQDSGKQKTKGGSSEEDDYDEESSEEERSEGSADVIVAGQKNMIASSRLRSKAQNQQVKQSEMEERKENQMKLHKQRIKDLKIRFDRGDI